MPNTALQPYAYSVAKLARLWDCSARHVYDLCARGELGHFRIGGIIRISESDRLTYEAHH
jgi:excisionase family DNA binding protein